MVQPPCAESPLSLFKDGMKRMGRKKSNYDQGAVMSSVQDGFGKGREERGIIAGGWGGKGAGSVAYSLMS